MKKQIKKWALRLTITILFIAGLLLGIILNPVLSYANKTTHNTYSIFHTRPLDHALVSQLDQATALLKNSEFYNPDLKLDICLNDGAKYPVLMQKLRGQAFAWGFYNKIVLQGNADYKKGYVELNGYKWNLTQLLAHEATHCLQFDKLGFWRSNPVAKIPEWKWEGYPEYISRQYSDQKDLAKNIELLLLAEKINNNGWIQFADGTGTVIPYYCNWLLVQYCMDIKKMTYSQVLSDPTKEETIRDEMMNWYQKQQKR